MKAHQNYRITFQGGILIVLPYPGDLPRLLYDAAAAARKSGSAPGLLLLEDADLILDVGAIVVVHRSAAGAKAAD